MAAEIVKMRVGKYLKPIERWEDEEGRLHFKWKGFMKSLSDELKAMEGSKFDWETKHWSIAKTQRNAFQLEYLYGGDPYARFDKPLVPFEPRRKELYKHQIDIVRHVLTFHQSIIAAEMGTGKTLALIEALEAVGREDVIWIGPRSALAAVELEFYKWRSKILPIFMTYEKVKALVENWPEDQKAPFFVVFDESSKVKTPTSQRSDAAQHLADAVRKDWGGEGYVVLMSGSPAPKSPADWWKQAEIACPGFLKEGNSEKFRRRLGLIVDKPSLSGGNYPHLVTWLDDKTKCGKCGMPPEHPNHDITQALFQDTTCEFHTWRESENEVERLYRRMKGLTMVLFKKDCFSGDSKLLTSQGQITFREAARIGRQMVYVRTDRGFQWIDCEIKSFGVQKTYPLHFGDGHVCRTTAGHRWWTLERGEIQRERKTWELIPKKSQLPLSPIELPERNDDFWEGMAHGFVFGDGHNHSNNPGDVVQSKVTLYGHDRDLKNLLLKFGTLSYLGQEDVVCNLPGRWKQLPTNPSRSYACGFVLGLQQADGAADETELRIYQANRGDLESVEDLAVFAGFRTLPIRLARLESPFDGSEKPLWSFSLQTYNMSEDYLLRSDYKNQFKVRGRGTATTVSWIGWEFEQEEEVFCAVVPFWQNFTLANGVNCLNCIDLPDKIFREIECKPTPEVLRAAKLIQAGAKSAITALIQLRELSDGFQYQDEIVGYDVCPRCEGTGEREEPVFTGLGFEDTPEAVEIWESEEIPEDEKMKRLMGMGVGFEMVMGTCQQCDGAKEVPRTQRHTQMVACPKDDKLIDIIDLHDDDGRLVTYGGFTGTIDRIVGVYTKMKWNWIRVDGRGWQSSWGARNPQEMLSEFQNKHSRIEKCGFIGHPGSAGMGLTLTRSSETVFYSNDFNGESRVQAVDRIHRPGMDVNKGATISDLLHLPVDRLIVESHKKKQRLMNMSLGQFRDAMKVIEANPLLERVI